MDAHLTRRGLLGAGLALALPAWAARTPPARTLVFEVRRNGRPIGRHTLTFSGDARDFDVLIAAAMKVSFGPFVLFRYRFDAVESWRRGEFARLSSRAESNGRPDQVTALRTAGGVMVKTLKSACNLPSEALPLTHWNSAAFGHPLFNPQTGELMRESVARQGGCLLRLAGGAIIRTTRYAMTGLAQITDWYDPANSWLALAARAGDGSRIDYRRVV